MSGEPRPVCGLSQMLMKRLPLLLPAMLALTLITGCRPAENVPAPAPRAGGERNLPVQAVEVAPRDLSRVIQISAPVEPLRQVQLATRTDGILTEVLVEEGDTVLPGQVLARIDVREQQAELLRARAQLAEREATFERYERLIGSDYIDQASFEAARANLAVARAEVEIWKTRVEFGTVRSNIEGVVVARRVEPGESVARLAPLFLLASLHPQVLRLGVSELDVTSIGVGQTVVIQVDALAAVGPLEGRVRRVFPAAEVDSRLVTVEVELLDAAALGVRPGFLARAELVVDRRAGVLAVPVGSLARTPEGAHYVMVINGDNRLERRAVEPGVSRGVWREILAGLAPGERIVASNPLELNEGSAVRIVGWAG